MARKNQKKESETSIPAEEIVSSEESNVSQNQSIEAGTSSISEQDQTAGNFQTQIDELNNKYVRLYSDFDNFRKRTIKEKADLISSASESVLRDLLSILDDFERGIENNEKSEDIANVRDGFKLIHQKLFTILTSKGLEKVESKGEVFDPEKHEAVTKTDAGAEMKGKVFDVLERGYNLYGKPLRYAKVVVGQ